jgi:hypothetical protein
VRGRAFNAGERPAAPTVVVINQTMARQMFPNEDPVGKRIRMGSPTGAWSSDRRRDRRRAPQRARDARRRRRSTSGTSRTRRSTRSSSCRTASSRGAGPAVRAQLQALDKDISAYDDPADGAGPLGVSRAAPLRAAARRRLRRARRW